MEPSKDGCLQLSFKEVGRAHYFLLKQSYCQEEMELPTVCIIFISLITHPLNPGKSGFNYLLTGTGSSGRYLSPPMKVAGNSILVNW